MAQIFRRSMNQLARATLVFAIFLAFSAGGVAIFLDRSPLHTKQGTFVHQDVPFSHDHHTEALGIDCRYCHTSVEESAFAGIPPTATCMNCHKQIWSETELLAPVRESFATNQPLVWQRVNDLPDYTYFNHSIHVHKGIGCKTCHGPVNEMPLVYQANTLQMGWCLDCHRHPEDFVRPRSEVFNMTFKPEAGVGRQLVEEHGIESLTNCSTCHR